MVIEQLFFELLQVAIGNRKNLSRVPTAHEWGELYNIATRQALTGVCFVGLQKALSNSPSHSHSTSSRQAGSGQMLGENLPEVLRLKWLGMTAKIQQRNQVVNSACVDLVKQYTHDGLSCCVLKGQGNLVNYPEELREARNPGDIDIWCKAQVGFRSTNLDGRGALYKKYHGKQAVIEYVKMQWRLCHDNISTSSSRVGEDKHEVRYHHIDAPSLNGVNVEVHFRPLFLDSPLRNCRLQQWFRENEQFGLCNAVFTQEGQTPMCKFPVSTVSFNAVYQLVHIYRHLFDEGIGLRQLLDYYFVLCALHIEQGELTDRTQSMAQWAEGMGIAVKSNEEIMHTLGRFGMKKFASAVMYVLQTVFEAPLDPPEGREMENGDWRQRYPWMICEPNETEGKFLLNEIMQAGNFGKYDQRIKHETPSIPLLRGKKIPQQLWHAIEKTKHNLRLLTHYPEEVMWEPIFRVYHYIWRKLRLWRF